MAPAVAAAAICTIAPADHTMPVVVVVAAAAAAPGSRGLAAQDLI